MFFVFRSRCFILVRGGRVFGVFVYWFGVKVFIMRLFLDFISFYFYWGLENRREVVCG